MIEVEVAGIAAGTKKLPASTIEVGGMVVGTMKMVAATKVEVGGGSHHPGVGGRDGCWHHDASHLGLPEYQSVRVPEYQRAREPESPVSACYLLLS